MNLGVQIGKFRNGVGLRRALFKSIRRGLSNWARGQVGQLRKAFSAQGQHLHGGKRWEPAEDGGLVLIGSGRLKRSIKASVEDTEVTLIAGARHASYHQYGTEDIPRRRVVVITDKDERDAVRTLRRTIGRGINGSIRR